MDLFEVRHEHGTSQWSLALDPGAWWSVPWSRCESGAPRGRANGRQRRFGGGDNFSITRSRRTTSSSISSRRTRARPIAREPMATAPKARAPTAMVASASVPMACAPTVPAPIFTVGRRSNRAFGAAGSTPETLTLGSRSGIGSPPAVACGPHLGNRCGFHRAGCGPGDRLQRQRAGHTRAPNARSHPPSWDLQALPGRAITLLRRFTGARGQDSRWCDVLPSRLEDAPQDRDGRDPQSHVRGTLESPAALNRRKHAWMCTYQQFLLSGR